MKTRVQAHLGTQPPDWESAVAELTAALLEARYLDPLEPAWSGLSDDIANAIPDLDTKLRFWNRLERFFRRTLVAAYPGVEFSHGHILFRRALLLMRFKQRLPSAKRLLLRARGEDLRRGGASGESAASMWLVILEDVEEGELAQLSEVERGYMIDALRYSWNSALAERAPDPRVPGMLANLARSALPSKRDQFSQIALGRYAELLRAASVGLVVPSLACTAYLAEWVGIMVLRKKRVRTVPQPKKLVAVEAAYLSTLVRRIKTIDGSEHRVVSNLMATIQGLRNRIHSGNDARRAISLEPILAKVFPHLVDRLVIQSHGWLFR